jgi:hypothetical protein
VGVGVGGSGLTKLAVSRLRTLLGPVCGYMNSLGLTILATLSVGVCV